MKRSKVAVFLTLALVLLAIANVAHAQMYTPPPWSGVMDTLGSSTIHSGSHWVLGDHRSRSQLNTDLGARIDFVYLHIPCLIFLKFLGCALKRCWSFRLADVRTVRYKGALENLAVSFGQAEYGAMEATPAIEIFNCNSSAGPVD